MSENKEKAVRKVKVYTRRGIFLEEGVKTPPGTVVSMTNEQYKSFGAAVTKDIPDELEEE